MGYLLRRMIRDGAPPEWTALMRLVASEVADNARDPEPDADGAALPWAAIGVEGHWGADGVWHDGLAEICGASPRAISDALTGLARLGYEMRRQLGADKRGKPVYAYRGRAMQFVVPPLAPRKPPERSHSDATFADATDEERSHSGATKAAESPHQSATKDQERSHSAVKRSHQSATPSPQVSSKISLSTILRAAQPLAGLGATEREIDWIVTTINTDPTVGKKVPYLREVLKNGDGPDLIADARQALAAPEPAAGEPGDWPLDRPKSWPPHCGDPYCSTRTSMREDPETRNPLGRCTKCHPDPEAAKRRR